MGFDEARQYLHQVAGQPLELVCLSGGEPCLHFDLVARLLREARALGVASIWVFTNAFWAVDRAVALRKLASLKESRVTRLCLSADGFHPCYTGTPGFLLRVDK